MSKMGIVYMMTNKNRTTLYIGVTNDLCRRIYEHKNHVIKGSFTDKYNLEYCIYYEEFPYFNLAILREKELKKWNRQKKENLINKKNPEWKVLVTEKGFVRNTVPFSQQVSDLENEMRQNIEIPPHDPNGSSVNEEIPPLDPNGSSMNEEIPPYGRNDSSVNEEIPPYGRNDERLQGFKGENGGGEAATILSPSSSGNTVISSEARNLYNLEQSEETKKPTQTKK